MKHAVLVLSVSVLTSVGAANLWAADKTKSEEAFDRLASLGGEWKGELSGTPIRLTYTLTAEGSALMEEFRPQEGPVMITMFTVDGDHLMATHYCGARNQPQMVTPAITDAQTEFGEIAGLRAAQDALPSHQGSGLS